MGDRTPDSITFAIQGCCHGELDAIYERIGKHQELSGTKVDVLLCCGDFQSLRNTADYHSLAVPPKYRNIGSFWKYYAGIAKAPVLTIFIGGNHEASQPLSELYYGGWVAPNIYYLGAAGVVRLGGIRIGGLSGIYKSHDYTQGRHEQPPYDRSSIRSVYHVRNLDVYKMKSLEQQQNSTTMDIMLSHDWPQGIEQHGNTEALLRKKPFFREEVQRNDLGSLPNWEVLQKLQPKWWFSAHLHVKFSAQVQHHAPPPTTKTTSSMTSLIPSQVAAPVLSSLSSNKTTTPSDDDPDSNGTTTTQESTQFRSLESSKTCGDVDDLTDQMTRFLSLDKCLPRRQYLSILHVPSSEEKTTTPKLEYDVEWLAILKKTHHLTVTERRRVRVPSAAAVLAQQPSTKEELDWVRARFGGSMEIPNDFMPTVQPYSPGESVRPPLPRMGNPQTDRLLQKLELQHIVTIPSVYYSVVDDVVVVDENEIDIDDEEDDVERDENEIDLDSDVDDEEVERDENEIDLDDMEDDDDDAPDENEINLDNVEEDEENGATPLDETATKKARLDASEANDVTT